jgi:hypothetical protein
MSFDPALDRREAILDRLLAIGQGLNGIASAWRDHGPTATGVLGVPRPAFLLYDGDTKLMQDVRMHKSQKMPPTIWCMSPQIVVVLQSRDTVENAMVDGSPAPVGPEMSSWMSLINNLVTNDDQIIDLLTPNGTHYLSAVQTDMKIGRALGAYGAWLMMMYEFYYPLFPPR